MKIWLIFLENRMQPSYLYMSAKNVRRKYRITPILGGSNIAAGWLLSGP